MRILAVYDDPYWESETIETIRFTSRVFLRRDQLYAFLKIVGEDGFGKRNHYETLGVALKITKLLWKQPFAKLRKKWVL